MPSIYQLKPAFQNLLRPLVQWLAKAGVTPNMITLLAVFLSVGLAAILVWQPTAVWAFALWPVGLFLRMGLNAMDGMLAREHQMQSPLGLYANELGDVVADAAMILAWLAVPGVSWLAVAVVAFLSMLTEYIGVLGVMAQSSRRYDGPLGKSDRAFLLGLAALLSALGVAASTQIWGWWLAAILLLLTCINRVHQALRTKV